VTAPAAAWDPTRLPDQRGRTIVVTGGNAGVGYFVSEQLAAAGARVVLAARSPEKAHAAMEAIRTRVPGAALAFVRLDLSSLDSVRTAAAELRALGTIDVLVQNAGLTGGSRQRETTADGLEIMVGTNAFGHFALLAGVWPALAADARIVGLGSLSTQLAKADLDDLQQVRGRYSLSRAYAYSKHAVHALGFELDRRLRAAGSTRASVVAHPGFALDTRTPPRPGVARKVENRVLGTLLAPMTQGKDRGAWPVVRAAIDPLAEGGRFWGPRRRLRGLPVVATPPAQSAAPEFGAEVWRQAEAATGVDLDVR
jgi:NAD(P)-dependent dehydrogenase (short-subunit alcohol dehydrogenase family)